MKRGLAAAAILVLVAAVGLVRDVTTPSSVDGAGAYRQGAGHAALPVQHEYVICADNGRC
jgi:hypothetical protein